MNLILYLLIPPPLTRVSDTLVLGNYCRKMLYVIRPFLTFKESIPFAQEQTKQFDIEIIGLILNAMNLKYASGYYKYGYGYGYGSEYGSEKSKNVV